MANYDSPLGSKKIYSSPLREFEVPDGDSNESIKGLQARMALEAQEEQDIRNSEAEREFQQARRDKISGKERLNDGAKRRIEMLLGITKLTREVEIKDTKFRLTTLRAKEMREAISIASEFDGTIHSPFEIRRQLLARSLTHIANVEVSQFIGSDSLEQRLLFVDELDDTFLTRLYTEYTILSKDSKEQYSIKTPEEAKEVVQDLKK